MRKIALFAAIALAGTSIPAFAAPAVAVAIDLTGVDQTSGSTVNQAATAVDLAIGAATNSTLDATAVNGNNMANVDKAIDQTAGTIADVAIDVTGIAQRSAAPVVQSAFALTGSGALNGSTSSALAGNFNNQANVKVTVTHN